MQDSEPFMSENSPNLESLFLAALEIASADERRAFIERTCGADHELQEEVEKLLRSHEQAGSFLDHPAPEFERTMLQDAPDDLADVLESGLARTFPEGAAVVIGSAGHSVLKSLGKTIGGVPQVLLRETAAEGPEPIVRPKSAEMPNRDPNSRYQLQGEIARGGMGAILKGRDTDLGRDLAIKVLLDVHKDKPEVIQRFIEEAQIGGQLQHPGIAPVYELGQFADRRPFFSMKLVKGETLSKLLADRDEPAAERGKFLGIFEHVCQTMAYAHSRGVIHRDLKPANVMVGAFGEVQVMDWGLAKVLPAGGVADEKKAQDQQQARSIIQTLRSKVGSDTPGIFACVGSNTQMGSVMGTPAYMPPEQALGEIDNMDERADVFGLGAILCEILTGKPPYVGEDGTQVFRMASRGKLTDCFTRLDACGADAELIALVKHCLELEPQDRPCHAGELAERVTGYLESVETRLRETELERASQAARADAQAKQAEAERQRAESETRRLEQQQRSARKLRKMLAGLSAVALIAGLACVAALVANKRANDLADVAQKNEADANRQRLMAQESLRQAVNSAIDGVTASRGSTTAPMLGTLDALPRDMVVAELKSRFANPEQKHRLGVAYALARYGEVDAPFLVSQIPGAAAEEADNLATAFRQSRDASLQAILASANQIELKQDWRLKARLAVVALHLNEPGIAIDMCRIDGRTDPIQRTIFIDELTTWHPNVTLLAAYGRLHSDHALRSGLCLVMGSIPLERLTASEIAAWSPVLAQGVQSAPDSATHSAAGWALRKWNSDLPLAPEADVPRHHRQWVVNSLGLTLLKIEPGEFMRKDMELEDFGKSILAARPDGQNPAVLEQIAPKIEHVKLTQEFFLSDREITVAQFQKFISDADYPNDEKPQQWPTAAASDGTTMDHPIQMVNWDDAVLFCNWLSRSDGLTPCYERTGKRERVRAFPVGQEVEVDNWRLVSSGTGYRLPTEAEWEYACRAGTTTDFACGTDAQLLRKYAVYAAEPTPGPAPCGSKLPNGWGLFDMHGNVFEWCQDGYGRYAGGDRTDPVSLALDPTRMRVARGGSSWARRVTPEAGLIETFLAMPMSMYGVSPGSPSSSSTRMMYPNEYRAIGFRVALGSGYANVMKGIFVKLRLAGHVERSAELVEESWREADSDATRQATIDAIAWNDDLLKNLAERHPDEPQLQLALARNLTSRGKRALAADKPDEALTLLTQARQVCARIFSPLQGTSLRETAEADATARTELRLDARRGEFADLYLALAQAQAKSGQTREALASFTDAVKLTTDRAGQAQIIAAAALFDGALEKLAENAAPSAPFQAELARHYAEHGQASLADGARGKARALLEAMLTKEPENSAWAMELADVLLPRGDQWTVLTPIEMKTETGAALELQNDGSIFVPQKPSQGDTYTLVFPAELKGIRGLRLEALADSRLPAGGPGWSGNGNFVVNELTLQITSAAGSDQPRSVVLQNAVADFSQVGWHVRGAVDGVSSTGWAVLPQSNKDHTAVFELAEPVGDERGSRLTIRLVQQYDTMHVLARFRLSVCIDAATLNRDRNRFAAMKIGDSWGSLAAAYHFIGDQAALEKLLERHQEAAAGIGDLYAAVQNWERAIAEYSRGITDRTADAGLVARRAEAYAAIGDWEKSAADWLRVARLRPEMSDKNLLKPANRIDSWRYDIQTEAKGSMLPVDNAISFTAENITGTNWHLQVSQTDLDLKNGEEYVLKFQARSDGRGATLTACIDEPDWHEIGLHEELSLTEEYKPFEFKFRAVGVVNRKNRIQFVLGAEKGTIVVKDMTLTAPSAYDRLVRSGRWGEAAQLGLALIDQKPEDSLLWLQVAPVLVLAGDGADYPALCRRMVHQFGDSQRPEAADRVAKTCLLQAGFIDLLDGPGRTLADYLDGDAEPAWLRPYAWACRALFAYRKGDSRSAVKYAAKSSELNPDEFIQPMNLAVTAMARHNLDDSEAARRDLDEAAQFVGRLEADSSKQGHHDLLIARILVREAQALISGRHPSPQAPVSRHRS
jgi:serine/threonine protein kinase/formylglycine-generating enzyme required for sulfatase activity/tetratricopeptide (TPR) repeat protein